MYICIYSKYVNLPGLDRQVPKLFVFPHCSIALIAGGK